MTGCAFMDCGRIDCAVCRWARTPVSSTVCAWCGLLITAGDPTRPISHGCCPACAQTWQVQAEGTSQVPA